MAIRNAEARLPNTFITLTDADRRALRAFWRGVCVGVCGLAALGAAILGITAVLP